MKPRPPNPARSALMARVRQRGTKPEQIVASALVGLGIAFRRNHRILAGAPDFSNRTKRWAIYVHGCFWHHHTACKKATTPNANHEFWQEKFRASRRRDAAAIRALRGLGLRVTIVWECETRNFPALTRRLSKIFESRGIDVRQPVDH